MGHPLCCCPIGGKGWAIPAERLWENGESYVADERSFWSLHSNFACSSASRYGSDDEPKPIDLEGSGGAMKGYAGSSGQIGAEDFDLRAHLARSRQSLDEWSKTHG